MLLVALLSLLISFTGITDHPRLLLPQGEEQLVLQAVEADEGIAKVHQGILEQSEAFLTSSPVIYKKEGKRLLFVSREALKRIFYLSYSYRMTGEERYAARAVQEMLQVCSFADWNPSHFLDTAEMALGVAIGYDWLYDYMSEEDRAVVRKGLIDNAYSEATGRFTGFYKNANNWNQVCNAGLLYAALALYEDTPEESQAQIKRCIDSNPVALTCYGPDGAYPEGFNYWGYGTSFQVLLIEALQTALGDDYDLSEAPGYLKSAYFLQMASAPSGKVWNFYDAREQTSCNMMLYWFAAQLGDPSVIYLEQQRLRELPQGFAGESGVDYFAEHRLLPCLPIFARKMDLSRNALPQQKFFVAEGGNTPLFIYRQGWKSREDVYMAVKGGSASTSHAHMDAGSFIYEKDGERWVMDLPMQEYITLESKGLDIWNMRQDSDRWDVFRMGNDSHSTVSIKDRKHMVNGSATITKTWKFSFKKGAQIDLQSTLGSSVSSALRSVWVDLSGDLHLRDELTAADEPVEFTITLTTPAEVSIDGDKITLEKSGKSLKVKHSCNYPYTAEVLTNEPPHSYDTPNPGSCRLRFTLAVPAAQTATFQLELK